MKKIILLGVIAVMLLFTASTAMEDTIVWQIGVFDDLYGVTDGTEVTDPPDKSTAPIGTVTVDYTDVSTFYSVLLKGTTITGTFTADLSKGAVLLISWSPGKSGTEKFSVTLGGTTMSSRTVTGSTCTSDPPDGRCGQVPSYYSNLSGLPYYTEIFDFGPVESGTEIHTLSINYSQGDGIGFDYLKLSTLALSDCVIPPADMMSWWPGDGNADDIWDGNHGIVHGVTFEAGKVGDAFSSFNGANDRIDLGNPTTLKQAFSHLTIDAWVKPSQNMPKATVISCTHLDGWAMRIFNGQLRADLRLTDAYVGVTAGTVPLNVWSHVAITYDQSTVRVFINGTEVGNASGTGTIGNLKNAGTNVFIGNEPVGTSVQADYAFYGDIDEVEIFDRALLQSEIQGIYNAGSAGKCKEATVIEVDIDIKPGSDPNSINLGEHGLLPVAILGTPEFDVTTIDPWTIVIGSVSLAARGSKKAPKLAYSFEDINDDGYIDMMTFFDVQDLVTYDQLTSATTALELTAILDDLTPIKGTDSVNIVH